MNTILIYGVIFVTLLFLELIYFRIADKCNIIDKPNERSSHSSIVLRGGGIIFLIGVWVWSAFFGFQYPWFLAAVTLAAGISFVDDIRSLPDSVRLVVQFTAMGLMLYQLIGDSGELIVDAWWMWPLLILGALIVCVGATNVINFMDGINGITAGYSLAVLVPLLLVSRSKFDFVEPAHALHNSSELGSALAQSQFSGAGFIDESYLVVAIIGVLVFCLFNFRPKGKAKCFAGDVGSIGIAFIMLFAIGKLIMQTGDITYLIFLLVYGVDGCLTICHRIMLHENLGEAHRKHVFQLMANELKIGHVKVTLVYMAMQLAVSLGFIYLCPNTIFAHWMYMIGAILVLAIAYVLFKKRYYHLHEEYLRTLQK
jgi:UDP-N-acetylmuramyl pentapeptide phosphotransferase/UDP-N-acetylglucosamine-1-phosphate transferase